MSTSFERWLKALSRGDEVAINELWNLFYVRLCRRVAGPSKSLRWFDQEDIALDALADVCDLIKRGQFRELSTIEELWSLLATIAARRTSDRRRYEQAACRGGSVRTLSFHDVCDVPSRLDVLSEYQTTQLIGELLCTDNDGDLATVIRLRMSGSSNQEVADELGCCVRKVQYMVEDLARRYLSLPETQHGKSRSDSPHLAQAALSHSDN